MNDQQGFVVGLSSRGRPVEGSCDHGFLIDYGELVVQFVASSESSGADPFQALPQRMIASLHLAGLIWKGDPQQIEHF